MTNDKWLGCVSIRDIAVFLSVFFFKILCKEFRACQTLLGITSHYFQQYCSSLLFFTFRFPLYTVISCTPLVPPSNGMISPTSCLSRSTYGQSCRFSCQRQGYSLEGSSVRVCGSDGEWTGNNDTICKGEDNCVQLLTVAC